MNPWPAMPMSRSKYMPASKLAIGTLREAVCYPAAAATFTDAAIAEALKLLDLNHLVARLDESEPWDQQLSVDEQQRLTFARAFLHRPEWLILDDATGALDEAMEQRVYETLAARLPDTSVLSITNRPTVAKFHQRHWTIVATADGARYLAERGVNGIKVGIGPGGGCTTRLNTNFGVPQLQALVECRMAVGDRLPLIADGGIRRDGAIIEALLFGGDTVMLGNAFAGTAETPGETVHKSVVLPESQKVVRVPFKVFRGMASIGARGNRPARL